LTRLIPEQRWCSLRLQYEHQRERTLGALLQASAVVMVLSFMGDEESEAVRCS
jgi:hypothetical protein